MKSVPQNCRHQNIPLRNLLRKMNVKVVCTTDDPIDITGASPENKRRWI